MLAIYINVLWLPLIAVVSVIFGIIGRGAQLAKSKRRIISLENEMLANHADILKLQQDLASVENGKAASSTRVVPMKESNATDDSQKNVK